MDQDNPNIRHIQPAPIERAKTPTAQARSVAAAVSAQFDDRKPESCTNWVTEYDDSIAQIFRDEFAKGGLEQIDTLIDEANTILRSRKSRYVFAPGAAYTEDRDGKPKGLMVFYCLENSDERVCNQFIPLQKSLRPHPPEAN